MGIFFQGVLMADDTETGKIIEKVVCKADAGQSYAMYLPSAYTAEKKWPIIYAFHPGANGPAAVRQFEPAAEKYGYIVVSSNNAQNGPWEPIQQAGRAVWIDTRGRLAIDDQRIYSSGFSGGARVASVFRFIAKHPVAGIIACGAGLNTSLTPQMLKPSLYYGIVGLGDFNYSEMMRLEDQLTDAGIQHRILVFNGRHEWPPVEYCTMAVDWMEIQAVKQGLKPKNEQLSDELFNKAVEQARQWETEKNIFFAVSAYEDAGELFDGLADTSAVKEKLRQLKESKEYKRFLKEEKKREKKEAEFLELYRQVMSMIRYSVTSDLPGVEVISRDLEIPRLQKEAARTDNIYDRGLAQRLLFGLGNNVLQFGSEYMQQGDSHRAGIFFDILDRLNPGHPSVLYNLACYYSRFKQKKKALKYLEQAIEKGFNSLEHIEKDTDLDFIRNEPEYKVIIERLQKGGGTPN